MCCNVKCSGKCCLYYLFCCCVVKFVMSVCKYLMGCCDISDTKDENQSEGKNEDSQQKMRDVIEEDSGQSLKISSQSAKQRLEDMYGMIKRKETDIFKYETPELIQFKGFLQDSHQEQIRLIENVDDLLDWRKKNQITLYQRAQLWWTAFSQFYNTVLLILGGGIYTFLQIYLSNSQHKELFYGIGVVIVVFLLVLLIVVVYQKRKIESFRTGWEYCCPRKKLATK